MNYDSIAYKVENGIITNVTLVNPQDTIEPGFIKRNYPLAIGYVEKFNDYYPPDYTQERYDTDLNTINNSIQLYKTMSTTHKDTALAELNNLEQGATATATTETADALQSLITNLGKYLTYLDNFVVQNPLQQKLFTYEESGLWDAT